MTISKLTNTIKALDEINKINELVEGVNSNAASISNKQDTLVSGTNIKTINGAAVLGAGNLEISGLPSQTGNANKFLTTDGTNASWSAVPIRNIGEIVSSSLPLTDAGLHLLDGTRLSGDGIYKDFVDYIAELYANSPKKSNVTKVGSLTDNNGVLSGFSINNYAQTSLTFNPGTNAWDMGFKIHTASEFTIFNDFVGQSLGIALGINTDKHFNMALGVQSAWSIGSSSGAHTVQPSTDYWVKIAFDGTKYTLDYSLDGVEYINDITINSSTPYVPTSYTFQIGKYDISSTVYFEGSIDLKKCYINVNGSRWWSGANPSWAVDETTWQNFITTYGSCGKFVYDSTLNTVRLPKVSDILQGTTDINALGDLVQAGLPNITSSMGLNGPNTARWWSDSGQTGALYCSKVGSTAFAIDSSPSDAAPYDTINFNASRSSSIYGNSSTVQPQTIKCYYYIVIATSTKTDIQVDIDEITTDLNGKADADLTNVTDTAKVMMSGVGMPGNKYIDLTLGASGTTYIAPENGWFCFYALKSTAGYTFLMNNTTGFRTETRTTINGSGCGCYYSSRRGDIIVCSYDGTNNYPFFRFYYAVGSESEAS